MVEEQTSSYRRDNVNPNGPGTAFFGGPEDAGVFDGFQAEKARVPYANVGLVKLPDGSRTTKRS